MAISSIRLAIRARRLVFIAHVLVETQIPVLAVGKCLQRSAAVDDNVVANIVDIALGLLTITLFLLQSDQFWHPRAEN